MNILEIFKSKWRHSDSHIRQKAVKILSDQVVLTEIVMNDQDSSVRQEAAKKITDENVLTRIISYDCSSLVRQEALNKLTNQHALKNVAMFNDDRIVRLAALKRIQQIDDLCEIVDYWYEEPHKNLISKTQQNKIRDANEDIVSQAEENITTAFINLTNQYSLSDILILYHWRIRLKAIQRISDQSVLAKTVINDKCF